MLRISGAGARIVAFASVVSVTSLGVVGVASADGAATPFKSSYADPALGTHDTCSGARVVQSKGTIKDSETCTLSGDTSRVVAGTVVGNPFYVLGGVYSEWSSDFDGQVAKSVTLQFVANGDGTYTENVVAYY